MSCYRQKIDVKAISLDHIVVIVRELTQKSFP